MLIREFLFQTHNLHKYSYYLPPISFPFAPGHFSEKPTNKFDRVPPIKCELGRKSMEGEKCQIHAGTILVAVTLLWIFAAVR